MLVHRPIASPAAPRVRPPDLDHLADVPVWVVNQPNGLVAALRYHVVVVVEQVGAASRIQTAILPSLSILQRHFPHSYVYFAPKCVVSGDFYWFTEMVGQMWIAVGDCTGHGVPGAFLSFVGVSALREAVIELGLDTPADVLAFLHFRVWSQLSGTTDAHLRDGMDLALLRIPLDGRKAAFAGAMRNLWRLRDGECVEFKGTRTGIGRSADPPGFTELEVDLAPGDELVLFTDGIADQIGGKQLAQRLGAARLRSHLLAYVDESPVVQQQELVRFLAGWRGLIEQTDDQLLVQLRVD